MKKPGIWETGRWLGGWLAVVLVLSAAATSDWGETVLDLPAIRDLESLLLLLAVTVAVVSVFYGFVWVYGIASQSPERTAAPPKPTRQYRGIPLDPTAPPKVLPPKRTVKLRYRGVWIERDAAAPPPDRQP